MREKRKIILVGNPNVGKSALFNCLTGQYVVVSNYPGTSVEVARGTTEIDGIEYEVVDTPGMYSLLCLSEEERVSRRILMEERADVVVHVVDAKNLDRMLSFTLQLLEAGFPLVLALNIMDEAEKAGIRIDTRKLELALKMPVVPTSAVLKRGIELLRGRIGEHVRAKTG